MAGTRYRTAQGTPLGQEAKAFLDYDDLDGGPPVEKVTQDIVDQLATAATP